MSKKLIEKNQEKLLSCKRHLFIKFTTKLEPPFQLDVHGVCENCGGYLKVSEVVIYCRGYMAAGRDISDIIPEGIK